MLFFNSNGLQVMVLSTLALLNCLFHSFEAGIADAISSFK